MSRLPRIVVPGLAHHVTQRGNRRAVVFDDDFSRRSYLALFDDYRKKYGLEVWAYCLMSNHVHWVVVPRDEGALGRCFRDTHTAFAALVNQRRRESGHLWQGRFFSCPLDEAHIWAAVRYVERNPVRAKMVARAEDYPWSSAAGHCGRSDDLLSPDFPPRGVIQSWSEWLGGEEATQSETIRRRTRTGRPCGTPAFTAQLENLLNRVLGPQKAGRKKRANPKNEGRLFNE